MRKWRTFLFDVRWENESPMFKKVPFTVGVKSVLNYSDFMQDYPLYVTERDGNQGFEDLVHSILSTK